MEPEHPDQLTHSPTGRLRIGRDNRRHLQRPDGQYVAPTPGCYEPVLVNVYDLHWTNRMTSRLRLAAYHSGVQLHKSEFTYGDDGVRSIPPRDVSSMAAKMAFKKSVHLGFTTYSLEDTLLISDWLDHSAFASTMYNLLRRNCNHFSAALGCLLCPHAEFPTWINSLASLGTRLPFVERGIRHFIEPESEDESNDSSCCNRHGLRAISANLSKSVCSEKQQISSCKKPADSNSSKN